MFYLKLYALSLPVFLLFDLIWLSIVAKNLYQNSIGHLLGNSINWKAAITFYLLYVLGIIIFAVLPGLEKDSLARTISLALLFGFFTYATYDLTNLATLKDWPLYISIIDILWGMFLCSSVAACSFHIGRWLVYPV